MSAPRSPLICAGAVLALTLAAPGTAAAAGDAGSADGRDGRHNASSRNDERAKDNGRRTAGADRARAAGSSSQSHGNASSRTSNGPSERGKARSASSGGGGGGQSSKGTPNKAAGKDGAKATARGGDAATRPSGSGDPRGNNGTIKIDTMPGDAERSNRPHPGCTFVLKFFNFDAEQDADITFTGQAPTRLGTLLTLRNQRISSTPADGELEAKHSLTLTAADLGLVGKPQAAKGWHVKVTVDALEAPGGVKQKVFWLDCPEGTGATTGDAPATVAEQAETPPVTDTATATDTETETETVAPGGDAAVLDTVASRATVLDRPITQVLDVRADRSATDVQRAAATSQRDTSVLASVLPFDVPASLPFTGPAALGLALATGLAAVGGGVLALRAGRRRVQD